MTQSVSTQLPSQLLGPLAVLQIWWVGFSKQEECLLAVKGGRDARRLRRCVVADGAAAMLLLRHPHWELRATTGESRVTKLQRSPTIEGSHGRVFLLVTTAGVPGESQHKPLGMFWVRLRGLVTSFKPSWLKPYQSLSRLSTTTSPLPSSPPTPASTDL